MLFWRSLLNFSRKEAKDKRKNKFASFSTSDFQLEDLEWLLNTPWAVFLSREYMKTRKIILVFGLIGIALGMVYIFTTTAEVTTYANFEEARSTGKTHQVVGTLSPSHEIDDDGGLLQFHLQDDNNETVKVVYNKPMPDGFKNSEKIVVTGSFKNELFVAEKILMKCPSKYEGTDGV